MARKNRSEAEWRSLVAQCEQSGEPGAAFCRTRGIPANRFWHWRRKLNQESSSRPAFVLATIPQQQESSEHWMEVCLGSGRQIKFGGHFDPKTFQAVVEVLEGC